MQPEPKFRPKNPGGENKIDNQSQIQREHIVNVMSNSFPEGGNYVLVVVVVVFLLLLLLLLLIIIFEKLAIWKQNYNRNINNFSCKFNYPRLF